MEMVCLDCGSTTEERRKDRAPVVAIPVKVGSDSDLNPVGGSEVKPGVFGAQRRWRSYGA